jgi:hypothetical protein
MPAKGLRVRLALTHGDNHQVEQLGGTVIAYLYGNKFFPAPPLDQLLHQTSDFGAKVDEPRWQQVCLRGLRCRRTHGAVKSRFASKSSHNKFRITDSH